jgi:tetratricopeptide (TPR) repeat protein
LQDDHRHVLEELGLERLLPYFDWNGGQIELLADDPAAAEVRLRAAYEALLDSADRAHLSTLALNLADAQLRQGRYAEAEKLLEQTEELGARDDAMNQVLLRCLRAKLLARQGDPERAEALAREGVELARATGAPNLFGHAVMDLGEILARTDRLDEAKRTFQLALHEYERKGNRTSATRARSALRRLPITTPLNRMEA